MATIRATIAAKLGLDTQDFIKGAKAAGASTEELEKHVDQAAQSVAAMGESLRKASRTATIAGGVLAAAMGMAVKAASDLQESQNVTTLVFEESAEEIVKFSKTARFSLGISERAAREATAQVGGLLKNMGLTMDQTVGYSKDLVRVASDMGSAFNTEPADAIYAIGAALRGETEPIRRYNVMLSDKEIRQEAVNLGLAESPKLADRAARAEAALGLIFKQTSDYAGDFTNTADGLANSSRSLSATFEDLRASIGNSALPFMEKFNAMQISVLETVMGLNEATHGLVGALLMFSSGGLLVAAPVLKMASAWMMASAAHMHATGTALSLSVMLDKLKVSLMTTTTMVMALVAAATIMVAVFYVQWKQKQKEFNEAVAEARQKLMELEPVIYGVTGRLQAMADALPEVADPLEELGEVLSSYALHALIAAEAAEKDLGGAMAKVAAAGIDFGKVVQGNTTGLYGWAKAFADTGTTQDELAFKFSQLSGETAKYADKLRAMVNAGIITKKAALGLTDILFNQTEMMRHAIAASEKESEEFYKSGQVLKLLEQQWGLTAEKAAAYLVLMDKQIEAGDTYQEVLQGLETDLNAAAERQAFFNAEIAQAIPDLEAVATAAKKYADTLRQIKRGLFDTVESANDLLERVTKLEGSYLDLTGSGYDLMDSLERLEAGMKGTHRTTEDIAAAQAHLVDMFRKAALQAGLTSEQIEQMFKDIALAEVYEIPITFKPVVLPGGGFTLPNDTKDALEEAEKVINAEFERIVRGAASTGTMATSKRFAQQLMGEPAEIKQAFEELFKHARDAGALEIPEVRAAFEKMLGQQPLLVEFAQKRITLTEELGAAQRALSSAEADQLKIRKAAFAFDERLVSMEQTPLENILKQITDARKKLGDAEREAAQVESQRTSYAAGVAKSFSLSLTTGRGGVMYQATRMLEHARNFKGYLDQLITAQFPHDVIRQVIDMGAIQGGVLARRLLALSPTEIEGFKNTYAEIGAVAASIGEVAATVLFQHDTTEAASELQKQQSLVESLFQQAMGEADNVAVAAQGRVDEIKTALENNDAAMKALVQAMQQEFGDAVAAFLGGLELPEELQAVFDKFISDFRLAMGETLANLLKLITTKPTPSPYGPGSPAGPPPDFRFGTNPPVLGDSSKLPVDLETLRNIAGATPFGTGSSDFAELKALESYFTNPNVKPALGFGGRDPNESGQAGLFRQPVFYANGGIATRPHMGVVAERGPEAIIPLSKLGDLGGSTYNINIRGGGYGADEIGRQVVRAIQEYERRNGTAWRS